MKNMRLQEITLRWIEVLTLELKVAFRKLCKSLNENLKK